MTVSCPLDSKHNASFFALPCGHLNVGPLPSKEASSLHAELFLVLVSMWCPCGNHMVSTFETTWCLHLKSHGVHMETMEMT